ncbi:MAG: HEAT repeat domain-containing protein [Chromatiaceae bacterium]|nr:HEAT repeat domain-containing protein [Chromatiaceae bacterium]
MTKTDIPDAELLIAPGCVHCPVVLSSLAELVKQGRIGRLDVYNISVHPEAAQTRGARAVPWFRIGPFELSGAHTHSELASWAERAGSAAGMRAYLSESLQTGQLDAVIAACRRSPELLPPLIALAGDLDTPFAARIGVGAVLEDLATGGLPAGLVDDIAPLAASPHAQVRADAAHFLGLTGGADAQALLTRMSDDDDREVREIASESLGQLATPQREA